MSKAKQKAGAASSETIQDISHEEVKHENGISLIPKLVTAEDQLKMEIAKFSIADAGIARLKDNYGALTIAGPEDKISYKKVRDAWGEVRSVRTGFEKKGLELRNGYGIITKGIKKEEDRLVELISPLEDDLYGKWKAIDEEKDRVDREKKEAEEAALNERLSLLTRLGMEFKDGFWQIGETITIDVATLRGMPEEQFQSLKHAVYAKASEIESERRRVEQERQREAERLQEEKNELARQQAEMKKAQEDLQRQKEELAQAQREAAKQTLENRIGKLVSLGMQERDFDLNYNNGFSPGYSIPLENIQVLSDDQFQKFLVIVGNTIKNMNIDKADHEEKVNQEKDAKAKKERFISEKMVEAGLTYSYNDQEFRFSNELLNIEVGWDLLLYLPESEIVDQAQDYFDQIVKSKAEIVKLNFERQQAAAKEAEAGMSDQELYEREINSLAFRVENIDPEYFKTKKYKVLATQLKANLKAVIYKK